MKEIYSGEAKQKRREFETKTTIFNQFWCDNTSNQKLYFNYSLGNNWNRLYNVGIFFMYNLFGWLLTVF